MASKNQRLNATVNIGGALTESFRGAISSSRKQIGRVGDAIQQLKTRERRLSKVANHWEKQGREAREYRAEIERINAQVGRLRRSEERLGRIRNAQKANVSRRGELRGQLFDAAAIGATLAAPLAIAVKFQKSMSEVGAVTNATKEDMGRLTKEARHLGATTQFSGTEAAQGMKLLGQAGYKTNQIIAAMPGVLNVAAAASTDLGTASDITSNILSGFNLKAKATGRVGDLLTNTFSTSNTNLRQLGSSMSYVAPVAKAAGVSMEDTAASIGKLGDAGIQGSQAGTALRAIISRLAAPTGQAAKMLDELGVKTKDAQGNMRALPDILADMNKAMEGMGSAAKANVNTTVFGLEAASAATVLLGKAGSGELQTYSESLKKTGTAARIAKEQNDNAWGSLKRLRSVGESMAITIGNVLLPTLTDAADATATVTGYVDEAARRFPVATKVVVGATVALGGLKVAAIAGGYGFTFLKGGALTLMGTLQKMRTAMLLSSRATGVATAGMRALSIATVTNPIGAAVTAIAVGGLLVYKYWKPIKSFFSGLWSGLQQAAGPVGAAMGDLFDALGPVGSALKWVGGWIQKGIGWFGSLLAPVDASEKQLDSFQAKGVAVGKAIGQAFATMTRWVTKSIQWLVGKIQWVGNAYSKVKSFLGFGDDKKIDLSDPDMKRLVSKLAQAPQVGSAQDARPYYKPGRGYDDDSPAALLRRPGNTAQSSVDARQTVNLTINQQPGEDSESVADRAVAKMREHDRRERSSALYDQGPAYGY